MQDFQAISPNLNVRVSPRARRLSLRLDSKERKIHLIIPKRASMRAAYQFALQNKSWIEEKLATLPELVPFHDGALIPVLNRQLRLTIDHDEKYKVTKISIDENRLLVRTSLDNPSGRITRFLKKLAETEFKIMADEKAARIDRKVTELILRDMKSRWGSCSKDGRMSLNWRLIFAPEQVYDYVIAHEVAHLIHDNHGASFWKLCEKLSTDFSTGSGWIRNNSSELMRFGGSVPMEVDPERIEG